LNCHTFDRVDRASNFTSKMFDDRLRLNRMASPPTTPKTAGLESLLKAQAGTGAGAGAGTGPAPVETWNPPYCGDIGLAILKDGTWLYQNSPIGRKALVQLFARVLRKDADGRTYLVTPVEKVDVAVADAPFLAVEMEVREPGPDQTLVFRTNVDDIVSCDAGHPLRFVTEPGSGGLKPYLTVRGRLEALVTRALYQDLVALAVDDPQNPDRLGVWSGGRFFPLAAPPVL
jgi:uncharacterized protein